MENEYGIAVANKYALFLSDEDPFEILKLQESKVAKKTEKTKKNAGKEKEGKSSTNKQNASVTANQEKKAEKVDQFSSPTISSESVTRSASAPSQGNQTSSTSDSHLESSRPNRPPRDRAKPRPHVNREYKDRAGDEAKTSESVRDNRPPRIRARGGGGSAGYRQERGGFGENRQFRVDAEGTNAENADKPNSIGYFERRERRQPRNGFADHPSRPDRDRSGNEKSEDAGGYGDKPEHDGAGGRGYPRRGGYGYRGRGRPNRTQFSDRSDQDRSGFNDGQGGIEQRPVRDGFNDNDGGNFMERPEREGSGPRRDSRGRRGGFGRGRGGFDRPPRRDYQRYGDRRPRQREGEGEAPSEEPKLAPVDGEPQQHENLQEGTGSSWAEQIDAADQEAKRDSVKQEDEGDDEALGDGGEPKVMTLDEWKAREDTKRVKTEFNIRKPGEGVSSDPQWKKMFMLTKKERPEEHEEDDDEQEEEHHAKAKNVLPIEIHFADDSFRGGRGRGAGRRGGTGGPRGRGSRGAAPGTGGGGGRGSGRWDSDESRGNSRLSAQGGRGGNYSESRTYVRSRGGVGGGRRERTPNFADEADFPSLGSNTQA